MRQAILLILFIPSALFAQFSIGPYGKADFNNYRIFSGRTKDNSFTVSNSLGWSAGLQMRVDLSYLVHIQSGVLLSEAYYRPFIRIDRGLLERTRLQQTCVPLLGGIQLASLAGFQPQAQVGFMAIWRNQQTEFFEDRVVRAGDERSWPKFSLMPLLQFGMVRKLGEKLDLGIDCHVRLDLRNRTGFNSAASQASFGLALRRRF
jgi:hypothetical protein